MKFFFFVFWKQLFELSASRNSPVPVVSILKFYYAGRHETVISCPRKYVYAVLPAVRGGNFANLKKISSVPGQGGRFGVRLGIEKILGTHTAGIMYLS